MSNLSYDTFDGDYGFSPVQKSEEAAKGAKDEPGEGRGKGGLGGGSWSHYEGRSIFLVIDID